MGTKVIGVRVPDDLAGEFERYCDDSGQTIGQVLRKAIDDILYPPKAKAILESGNAEVDQLKGELAEARAKPIEAHSPEEKARYFIGWLRRLTPEEKAHLAELVDWKVRDATPAEVVEVEKPKAEESEEGDFEVEELDGKRYRVHGQGDGLKDPERISWDLLTGKEKWIDLAAPLRSDEGEE